MIMVRYNYIKMNLAIATLLRLFIYIKLSLATNITDDRNRCNVLLKGDIYKSCTNREGEDATLYGPNGLNKNRLNSTNITTPTDEVCKNESRCRKVFKVVRIYRQAFDDKVLVQFSDMLHGCCGDCAKYHVIPAMSDISNISDSILHKADVILPVVVPSSDRNELYGFRFVPVIEVPSAYFFSMKESREATALRLIGTCLKMWPLLVICLLIAFISGFVTWVFEKGRNNEEFSRAFHIGILEGFWWSFISMSTVGYGDKTPKSFPGRLFAVVWIIIGITITSMLTGTLTNSIMESGVHGNEYLRGKIVGTLKNQVHDSTMIAQHEGIIRYFDFNDTINGIAELFRKLESGEIDGVLISRATYYNFRREINETEIYRQHKSPIEKIQMIHTEKFFRGDKLVAGFLVKDNDDYEYFRRYFEYNWLHIQGCYSYSLNYKEKEVDVHIEAPYTGLFYPFLYGALGVICTILLIGVLNESRKRHRRKSTNRKKAIRGNITQVQPY